MGERILIVGGGAREHALAWKLHQDKRVQRIYVAPGNAGTAAIAENLPISPTNIAALVAMAKEKKVDLVVIGPEKPLDLGIVDGLQRVGIPAFGTTRAATRLESSKIFARVLMERYGIPCPRGRIFSDFEFLQAKQYLIEQQLPIVIKADGLAAGKGVIIPQTMEEALEALTNVMINRAFDDSGRVIIDEYLSGREVSVIAFTDGKTVVPMVTACDYKKAYDGDQGPNTGGMGGYSPSEFLDDAFVAKITETILIPTVKAMEVEERPYKGVLYTGLMIMPDGEVKVLEFNARFGDPETQIQLPLLKTNLLDILLAVIDGTLDQMKIEWSNESCVGVVIASGGYPDDYQTGFPITGLNEIDKEILVFHAGTKIGKKPDEVLTDGGRVLTVVSIGINHAEARERVYANLPQIGFTDCFYRNDIALLT